MTNTYVDIPLGCPYVISTTRIIGVLFNFELLIVLAILSEREAYLMRSAWSRCRDVSIRKTANLKVSEEKKKSKKVKNLKNPKNQKNLKKAKKNPKNIKKKKTKTKVSNPTPP